MTQSQSSEMFGQQRSNGQGHIPGVPELNPEQLAAIFAAYAPAQQAQQAQHAFDQACNAIDAKTVMKQHEGALLDARQRAARPDPVVTIATSSDQISVHVNAFKVVKYVGAAILVSAAGYGLFLLVREGTRWIAKKYMV